MEENLVNLKINPKYVKFFKIFGIIYMIIIPFFLFGLIFYMMGRGLEQQKLIVTSTNIRGSYGRLFKSQIDLPLDAINSIESYPKSGVIILSTSSRKIKYDSILNVDEVVSAINNARTATKSNTGVSFSPISSADELTKYKSLLDSGIITQEEFDAKKKQLLGL